MTPDKNTATIGFPRLIVYLAATVAGKAKQSRGSSRTSIADSDLSNTSFLRFGGREHEQRDHAHARRKDQQYRYNGLYEHKLGYREI